MRNSLVMTVEYTVEQDLKKMMSELSAFYVKLNSMQNVRRLKKTIFTAEVIIWAFFEPIFV